MCYEECDAQEDHKESNRLPFPEEHHTYVLMRNRYMLHGKSNKMKDNCFCTYRTRVVVVHCVDRYVEEIVRLKIGTVFIPSLPGSL